MSQSENELEARIEILERDVSSLKQRDEVLHALIVTASMALEAVSNAVDVNKD